MPKPPQHAQGPASAPHQTGRIGLVSAVAFAVGTMVGGGVFALSGIVVADAGPAAIIGYIAAGLVMLLSALCFAAVSSRAAPGESGYAPVATELGPIWRFLTMWAFYIGGVTGIAYVLVSFGSYLKYFLTSADALVLALIAAVLLTALNLGPTGFVGRAETAMVVFKLAVLMLLVVFGLLAFAPSRFEPFVPDGAGSILTATALLFAAYTGFNVVTNMASAIKNPQRTVPLAILLSLAIVAVVYVGVAVALVTSGISSTELRSQGLAHAAEAIGTKFGIGAFAGVLVAIAACVSTLSGANANLLGSSELVIRMAAGGDIPSRLGALSKRGYPVLSVLVSGAIVVVLILTGGLQTIIVFSNVAAIIAMVIVDVAALRLGWKGWKKPGMRLPLGPVIPALAIVTALSQVPSLGWVPVLIGTALVASGLVFYVLRRHSRPDHVSDLADHIRRLDTPLLRFFDRRRHGERARRA